MSYEGSDYYDCNQDDSLMMEPRLLEYIKKKKFYKENNIHSEVLDKQYAITKTDMSKIKEFMKGEKEKLNRNIHKDFVDASEATFPSSEFKKDKRLDRIKAKQQREIEATEQRHDYNVISKSYDMYRSDRPFASASGDDFRKSSFHPNDWFKNSRNEINDELNREFDVVPKRSFAKSNTYVNAPTMYNGYLSDRTVVENNKHTIDDIIGQLDSYGKRDKTYNKWSKKIENENNYMPVPLMGISPSGGNCNIEGIDKDIDVDSDMRFGMTPFRGGKSLGYRSVAEHAFSYISSDIQDPNHVVMERGVPSRNFNKQTARPFKRDILP